MKLNLVIAEDFYDNPDGVRKFALSQPFNVKGNYPGVRTKPFMNDSMKAVISNLVAISGAVTNWHEDCEFTGAFQLCTAQSWNAPVRSNSVPLRIEPGSMLIVLTHGLVYVTSHQMRL